MAELNSNNPIEIFKDLLVQAQASEINDPNAFALATVSEDGVPQNRMVLLKEVVDKGFIFYTNKTSSKAQAMQNNPNVAMLFHWKTLRRQVRVTGKVENVCVSENQKYFNSRATISQVGAWASKQSQPLDSRQTLIDRVEEINKKFTDVDEVPCPYFWGGYCIIPERIEIWMHGENRLHDRFIFIKENDEWVSQRLYP